jgi:hypothetical protein
MTDPTTPVGPPPVPPSGPTSPSGPTGAAGFLDRIGWRGERRAAPFLSHALGAGGGALLAIGALVLGGEHSDDGTSGTVGAILCALLIAAAIVVMLRTPGPVRSGCVAALVLGVPGLWFFATTLESSSGSLTAFNLLGFASFFVLFLVPPTRGRGIFLGLALALLWSFVVTEVSGTSNLAEVNFESGTPFESDSFGDDDFDSFEDDDFGTFEDEEDFETDSGAISLMFGAAYLAAAWALDRKRLVGLATPFVAVGVIAAVTGAAIVGADSGQIGGGVLALAVGLAIGYVGSRGKDRRASVWIGALTAVIGVTVVIEDLVDLEDSATEFAIFALLVGAGIVVGAAFLSRLLEEPDDEQPEPPRTEVPTSA